MIRPGTATRRTTLTACPGRWGWSYVIGGLVGDSDLAVPDIEAALRQGLAAMAWHHSARFYRKMEQPIERVVNRDAMANPDCLAWYVQFSQHYLAERGA